MYESFFGLKQEPFSIAPDPSFLYMSHKHHQALALLNYGLARGASFVLLTGEIGAGKTTVWRRFLEELPSNFDVANVVNPKLDVTTLLARVCDDLGVERPHPPGGAGPVDLIDALHGHLLLAHAQGRRTLIVIDEAQALSFEVLEQLRLLTNLDSSGRKLQVMLIGQPELRDLLAQPALEPLAQRVVARYHLQALSESETASYIAHRLDVAGLQGAVPFDGESLSLIHRLCRGVPRRINTVCDRALAAAAAAGVRRVDRAIVEAAVAEVYGGAPGARRPAPRAVAAEPGGAGDVGRAPVNAWALAGVAGVALAAGVWLAPRFGAAPGAARGAAVPAADAATAAPAVAPAMARVPVPAPAPTQAVVVALAPAPSPAAAPASVTEPVPGNAPAQPHAVAAVPGTPAAAVPAPAAAFGSLDAIFTPATASEAAAWRALALRWGSSLAPGEPCVAAAQQALQCLRSRGGVAAIRQFDRPGLLRLEDAAGRSAHVLLTALSGDIASLEVAGAPLQVPLLQLARWWRGDFATYWRTPPGWRDGEPPGGWVAQRLAAIDGQGPAGGEALRTRLVAFQLAQGLVPDGVAGPLTLMQLGRAGRADGGDEPRLAARAAGAGPAS